MASRAGVAASTGRSWRAGRVWHRVPREPLPPIEAGRAVIGALLNGPGGPRANLKTGADDRAETSSKAVYAKLWRLGHAQKSAAFATTQDQLVAALIPMMGWQDKGTVEANRSAHGRSVRRWLDRLQAMGLLEWHGVRDNHGRWWRIELRLLAAPEPDRSALAVAQRRLRTFARREQRRRRTNPARRRDLGRVLRRSQPLSRPSRRRVARARARTIHDRRTRLRALSCSEEKVRSTPFGALASLGKINSSTAIAQLEINAEPETVTDRTGARKQFGATRDDHTKSDAHNELRSLTKTSDETENSDVSIEEVGSSGSGELGLPAWEDATGLVARLGQIERLVSKGRLPPTKFHVIARTREKHFTALLWWPAGRRVPDRVLLGAFEHATGGDAMPLPRDGAHRAPLERALARYGRYVEHRPVDADGARWPESPPAALARAMLGLDKHIARDGEPPRSPVYAIGRLNLVAKQMAADAKRANGGDRELQARRQRRRRLKRRERAASEATFAFRAQTPTWRSRAFAENRHGGEWARKTAIDAALAGELPGFEGLHGFLIRASDLLGRPDPQRTLSTGQHAYDDALDALRHVADFLSPAAGGSELEPPDGESL